MATTAEIERVEAKIIAQKGAKSCDKYDYLTGSRLWCGCRSCGQLCRNARRKQTGWLDRCTGRQGWDELCENLWMDTSMRKRKQCFECDWFPGKKLPSEL